MVLDGWLDGQMGGRVGLRIAYSYQICFLNEYLFTIASSLHSITFIKYKKMQQILKSSDGLPHSCSTSG